MKLIVYMDSIKSLLLLTHQRTPND